MLPRQVEEQAADPSKPIYLDTSVLTHSPSIALGNATRESLRLCDVVEKMLSGVNECFKTQTPQVASAARRVHVVLDKLTTAIQTYLTSLDPEAMNHKEITQVERILTFCTQMANAGDVLDRNVLPSVQKITKQRILLPKEMMQPLSNMLDRIFTNLRLAATLLLTEDESMARRLAEEKDIFRDIETKTLSDYYTRLRENTLNKLDIQAGAYMLELIRDLKRTNTHIVASAAYPVLDQSGLLLPSRLQPENETGKNLYDPDSSEVMQD